MSNQPLRVVYVAGSGHTGSTLLSLLMDVHPSIASVGEVSVKPKIRRRGDQLQQKCSCGALVPECPFWRGVSQRVSDDGFEFGPDNWTNDYRSENPLMNRLLVRHSSLPTIRAAQRWLSSSLPVYSAHLRHIDRVNVSFIRAVLAESRAEVFLDASKRSMRLLRLLQIPELDVKVVRLVRDVRGYAASAKRRGLTIDDAANIWKKDQDVIAEMTAEMPPDRVFLLRYEDLCGTLETTARRLWDFCGVAPVALPERLFSEEHHVLGNSMRLGGTIEIKLNESWRRSLDPAEQRRILQIAGMANRTFGYAQ